MEEIAIVKPGEIPASHRDKHPGYEYYRHPLTPGANLCSVSMYEIPPGKAAYPYHYHLRNEECFYIVSGRGRLRTPSGERDAEPGDFIFFPAGESGAHKLTNISENEPLIYIDFDAREKIDVAFYPDSGKVGMYCDGVRQIHRTENAVGYYDGE